MTATRLKINRENENSPTRFISDRDVTLINHDPRSVAISEIDVFRIKLVNMFKENESQVSIKERARRIVAAHYVRLDSKIFEAIWHYLNINRGTTPAWWKEKMNQRQIFIVFEGTSFFMDGCEMMLALRWSAESKRPHWRYEYCPIEKDSEWLPNSLAAVL